MGATNTRKLGNCSGLELIDLGGRAHSENQSNGL